MTKFLLAGALLSCSFTLVKDGPWFSGKIVYHNTFKTLAGDDVTAKLTPLLGADDPYYISDNSYKMYTDKQQLLELYTGDNNKYQFFMGGQAVPGLDAAVGTPGTVVTPLAQTATVAGYACQSLQLANATEGTSTVYYYAPKLRVNPERFAKHAFGDFYTYLKATNGALPLRMVVTNTKQGFVMTSEATSVQAMALPASEFVVDAKPR
jgi:hypothetical protein